MRNNLIKGTFLFDHNRYIFILTLTLLSPWSEKKRKEKKRKEIIPAIFLVLKFIFDFYNQYDIVLKACKIYE
ncbi:MAG: hypothetical protein J7L26_02795 [Candidatus Aminicenantes bacterium]|nr:hypothetical protein [Candidatus Aminicenantes bacterium]